MRRPRRTAPLLTLMLLLLPLLCAAAGCLGDAPAGVARGEEASQEPRREEGTSNTPKDPNGDDHQLSAGSALPGSGVGPAKAGIVTTPQSSARRGNDEQTPAVLPANAESEGTSRGVDAGSLSPKVRRC
ncbi:uncharacterized protein Tco025E_05393 [Trypanosoma conorhini]|uniref:Secreted protein n=1 Tax=Trypanosoma conorhini TaxID=83891 RepID=A0A3R7LJM6_9TRYP|nr:uncharacterized protein Tco025E_05393 [Trypanosoma conorhini]RNF15777.1 hypothetical protein Tco025E_05393 [Trypanosoma conorhini]